MADEPSRSKPAAGASGPAAAAGHLNATEAPSAPSLDATGAYAEGGDALLGTQSAAGKTADFGGATQGAEGLDQTKSDTGSDTATQDADEESLRTSLRDFRLIKK